MPGPGRELSTLGNVLAKAVAPYSDAQSYVRSRSVNTPPTIPPNGYRWIIPENAIGVWAGRTNQIATWQSSPPAWVYLKVIQGVTAWIRDEQVEAIYNGFAWILPASTSTGGEGGGAYIARPNLDMPARTTAHDGDRACDIAIAVTPVRGAAIRVLVNGLDAGRLGDATKVGVACYLSEDGGFTAKALNMVLIGDVLHWNASVAGYQLAPTDTVSILYEIATT